MKRLLVSSSDRGTPSRQSHCALAVHVQVHVHVPAAAVSSPRLAPGISRSSIMQPLFCAFVAIALSFLAVQFGRDRP